MAQPEGPRGRDADEEEEPYTLDHLIADQRRQTRIVLAVFLLALLYFVARTLLFGPGEAQKAPPGPASPDAPAAPR